MRVAGEGLCPDTPANASPDQSMLFQMAFVSDHKQRSSMVEICEVLGVDD